jgi:hypothetical protein
MSGYPVNTAAQDNHYWAQQFGATSTLMGGAMTGGVSDNTAIYYNPGVLSFIDNTSLSVDANVYRMDKIIITDGAGKNMNLNSAQLSVYPQIISGMVNLFKESRFRFSYTMLTRNHGNILMNARYTSGSPQPGEPAITSYVGGFDYVNQLNEQWFGIGTGYRISEKLGAGATVFASYRGQTYQLTNYVQEVEPIEDRNVFRTQTIDEAVKYSTFRLLAKFGLSYNTENIKMGITLTTPSLGLYGSGNVQRENSVITVSEVASDMTNNFLIMDRKTGVPAHYKHPLSIAFGAEYLSEKSRLALSAEYYFKTNPYHLLDPAATPFVYPQSYLDSANYQPLINDYLDVQTATRPVLNAGIGFSREVYKQLSILLGASTDFTSYQKPEGGNELMNSLGSVDIYHFSGGLTYRQQKQSVTLGFTYSFTPSKEVPPYTIINQSPEITSNAIMSAHTYAIILGYTYYFSRTGE